MMNSNNRVPVTAVFDIGKTNKKFLLFNHQYEIVLEKSIHLNEIQDEDGETCENLTELVQWVSATFRDAVANPQFKIEALNFSTYGASFVHLGNTGKPATPLYNYLKKFPESLHQKFYTTYGDEQKIARATASPILGNLNSAMQIYLIKHSKPELFNKIKISLHLPQFISSLFTGHFFSEITSIGCHTMLWDFDQQQYHQWVIQEGFDQILPPITHSDLTLKKVIGHDEINCGIGLHDSSAALIPYLKRFSEPFMLLSTGTWCISLNPFNHSSLTSEELKKDCLCYLSYNAHPVKASRLFSGFIHEQQTKRIAEYFHKTENQFSQVQFEKKYTGATKFHDEIDLNKYSSYEQAYHALVENLINQQVESSMLVLKNQSVKRIFVDGGFSKNEIFMNLLAKRFPNYEIYATSIAQASALGAAMAISNSTDTPVNFPIKRYEYPS